MNINASTRGMDSTNILMALAMLMRSNSAVKAEIRSFDIDKAHLCLISVA
jgi:hypothetical protein